MKIIKNILSNKYCRRACSLVLFFFIAHTSTAQTAIVKASADKSKILLGEPFWLTLEIKLPQAGVVAPFKIDSIPHFEFIVKDSTQTVKEGDTTVIKQYFQLTSFDSGRWVIPPFILRPFVKTNSVLVDVVFTENFDPKKPYHDIQDIRKVDFVLDEEFEKWWYIIAALLILLTLIIHRLTAEKKPKQDNKHPMHEGAYKKALRQLQELKANEPDKKIFYIRLVEIFRTYVLEKTGIESLQQTSNNLVTKIQPLYKDAPKYDAISQVLYVSDFVKFAKYHPAENEAASAFDVIEDSIKYIEAGIKQQGTVEAQNT